MVVERFAKVVEVRPGRHLFCRIQVLGGVKDGDDNNDNDNDASLMKNQKKQKVMGNFVLIHGTAASEAQYSRLVQSMHRQIMIMLQEEGWQRRKNNRNDDIPEYLVWYCYSYDAMGCGSSPPPSSSTTAKDYVDSEQVQDLQAVLDQHVQHKHLPTIFVGHSYGATWIWKYYCLQQQQQQSAKVSTSNNNSSSSSSSVTPTVPVAGIVILSSGVDPSQELLQTGGPPLFRFVPLWMLQCLQPLLTRVFLRMGFSTWTHTHHPEWLEQAQASNNANHMQTVQYYYQAHDWLTNIPEQVFRQNVVPPILMLHGVQDGIIPIRYGQALANQCQFDLKVIENASHMILVEQPDAVAQHIISFVNVYFLDGYDHNKLGILSV